MVFEIEPDPQAADRLRKLMAEFSANAASIPLNRGQLLATMNEPTLPTGLDQAQTGRFKDVVVFQPLGDDMLRKIFETTAGKLLDKKELTPRQRGAAEKFVVSSMRVCDPAQGARGIAKQAAELLGGGAFIQLMEEYSPSGAQRGFENAIKTGAKGAGAAPATARFTRRRGS